MKVRVNIIANFLGQGWTALMGVVFLPFYIDLLGIEAYGLIGFFTMLQVWLAVLDMGIGPTTVREMARYTSGAISTEEVRDLLRSFELICIAIGAAIVALFWISADFIAVEWLNAQRLSAETITFVVVLIGVTLALRLVQGYYGHCLIGLQRQVWTSTVSAAFATLRGAGALIILLWVDRSVEAFFIWQTAVSVFFILTMGIAAHRLIPHSSRPARFSRAGLATVGAFAAGVAGISVLNLLMQQGDKLLLSTLLTLDQYGYYMLAATAASVLYSFIMPINHAIYPAMVEQAAHASREVIVQTFHRSAQFATAIVAPPAMVLILLPQPLLVAWSGDPALVSSVAPLLSIFAIGSLLLLIMQVPYYLQLAHGWTSLTLRANLAALILLIPAILLIVPKWGPVGAAFMWATLHFIYALVVAPLMFRRLLPGDQWRWLRNDVLKPAAAPFAVLLVASLLQPEISDGRFANGLFVVVSGAIALAAALAVLDRSGERLRALVQLRFREAVRF